MRRALSIVDLLVIVAVVALLVGALAPVLSRARGDSGQVTSINNLQTLSFALSIYAWDFSDRQPTWVPDDAGLFVSMQGGGNWATAYTNGGGGCPPPLILGWQDDPGPVIWGYFLGCGGFPGNSGNAVAYQPITFNPTNAFGSFRLLNAQSFSVYVDGRFYSDIFYAPNDTRTWELAEPMMALPDEFTVLPGQNPVIINSSYAPSPAAMWNPEVFSYNAEADAWYRNPNTFFDSFVSPSVGQCLFPELKTRVIEHNWNLGQPGPVNPAFAGGNTPYFFNSGLAAAPLTLFFDGHVAELPNGQVVADDQMILDQTGGEIGLWTRDTPLGTDGYYGAQSFDGTLVSHHVLTANGILGRDVLNAAKPTENARGNAAARRAGNRGPAGSLAAVAPSGPPARPPYAAPGGLAVN